MSAVRLVSYVLDPFTDECLLVAALVGDSSGVHLVRAPDVDMPAPAQANIERVLRDLEAEPSLDGLPIGAGAQVVLGELLVVPIEVVDAPVWVRKTLLTPTR